MIWILDDGPLDALSLTLDGAQLAGQRPAADRWLVADATSQSAVASLKRRLFLGACEDFEVFSVHMGSPAAEILYNHLRAPTTSDKNLAEHQAIAWALEARDQGHEVALVSQDKGALFLTLAELGRGAAAHPVEFWLYLFDRALITSPQLAALCERTRRKDQLPVPLRCQRALDMGGL